MKRIVILDGKTLGDIKLEKLSEIGEVKYDVHVVRQCSKYS